MIKKCIVDTPYGIKLPGAKLVNPNVPVDLNHREILNLLKRGRVTVSHIVGDKLVKQTISNYDNIDYVKDAKVSINKNKFKSKETVSAPADSKLTPVGGTKEAKVEETKLTTEPKVDSKEESKKGKVEEAKDVVVEPKVDSKLESKKETVTGSEVKSKEEPKVSAKQSHPNVDKLKEDKIKEIIKEKKESPKQNNKK